MRECWAYGKPGHPRCEFYDVDNKQVDCCKSAKADRICKFTVCGQTVLNPDYNSDISDSK